MDCTFVQKKSEKSPIGLLQYGDFIKEAGFGPGVVNIVTDGEEVGAILASHMDIDKSSLLYQFPLARKRSIVLPRWVRGGLHFNTVLIKSRNLKGIVLELGRKSPSIIFEDADIKNALECQSHSFLFDTG